MSHKIRIAIALAAFAAVSFIGLADPAFASSGGSLPWNPRFSKSSNRSPGRLPASSHSPQSRSCGGMLIFGGELNDFARRLCYVALVGGVLLGATQIVALFGATGASIGEMEARTGPGIIELVMLRAQGEGAHG